jgi:putative alpha-1,2-mannosidase
MLTGGRTVHSWAPGRRIYFAAQFSKPFAKTQLIADDSPSDTKKVSGKQLKAVLHYKTTANQQILVRVGISGVSAANALKNLRAEQPGWDFEATRHAAKAKWQQELSRIRIETNDTKQREIFYTSLYHMMLAPTLFDDVDGTYCGMDGQTHTLAAGEHNYSTYSLWDTFRALHPAFTLMQPDRVPQLVNCLRHARLAAAGQGDRHHDRLPLGQRDGGSLCEELCGHRLAASLQGHAQTQHGR